jgi:hypothetical protein
MWRIEQRIERLNELGFDVDELDIVTDIGGATVRIQPKVVEAGHHTRRLQGLTGLDVEEAQARRILNDFDAYAAAKGMQLEDQMVVAHSWLTQRLRAAAAARAAGGGGAARGAGALSRRAAAPVVPVGAGRQGDGHLRRRPRLRRDGAAQADRGAQGGGDESRHRAARRDHD